MLCLQQMGPLHNHCQDICVQLRLGHMKVGPETHTGSIPIKELYKDLYGAKTIIYSAIWRRLLIINFAIWWDSWYMQQQTVNTITFVR